MQRQDLGVELRQASRHAVDLADAGQEDEHVAADGRIGSARCTAAGTRRRPVRGGGGDHHTSTGWGEPSAVMTGTAEEGRDSLGGERRRHRQQAEVGPDRPPDLEGEGEAEVGLEVALVDLVEQDGGGAGERRVGLQTAGEDALGHDLDAGGGRRGVVAGAVADGAADSSPSVRCQARGHGPGRHATGLEHDDATAVAATVRRAGAAGRPWTCRCPAVRRARRRPGRPARRAAAGRPLRPGGPRRPRVARPHGNPRRPPQRGDRRPRRPRQDHPRRPAAVAVGRLPRQPGGRRPGHGLDRPRAREGHHHPRQEHDRHLRRCADQHRRHARPRRLRRRGRTRPVDGRRRAAPRRRVGGPAAADPVRAAQGAHGAGCR